MLGMGKGFYCPDYLIGRDLGDIITQACRRAVFSLQISSFCGRMLMLYLRRTLTFVLTPLSTTPPQPS